MITAVSNDAPARARTIIGAPGNATAVATSTTGLIAGAASMNVRAAAPVAPASPNNRRPTGTDPHSQPGNIAPPSPPTSTATAGRRGSQRANRSGETNTAISPLTTTPSARNGIAWTKTPQNTVPAVENAALPATSLRSIVAETAHASRMPTSSSIEPNRIRRTKLSAATKPLWVIVSARRGIPSSRQHRHPRATAVFVSGQCGQTGSVGARFLCCRAGEPQTPGAPTRRLPRLQSGSTSTFMSMNSSL